MNSLTPMPCAVVSGAAFYATFTNEAPARTMARAWGLAVRPYGYRLKTVNPDTKEAIDGEEHAGWSVWDRP